jgi:hypothetical protein
MSVTHGERVQGSRHAGRKGTSVFAANPLVTFWGTVIEKRVVMAVTGTVLMGFVIMYMLGNLKISAARRISTPMPGSCGKSGTWGWAMDSCSAKLAITYWVISFTPVGNCAGSPAHILRPSPATGHVAEILDVYDPDWAVMRQNFHISRPNRTFSPHLEQGC